MLLCDHSASDGLTGSRERSGSLPARARWRRGWICGGFCARKVARNSAEEGESRRRDLTVSGTQGETGTENSDREQAERLKHEQ